MLRRLCAVCDLRIRLRQVGAEGVESCLRYRSLVMGFGQRETTGGQWTEPRQGGVRLQRLVEVAGRTTAVLIVVLDEPLFKKSAVVSVTGSILYKRNSQSKSDVQDVLNSEIILKVEDLIQGNLVPFSQPKTYSEIDLISVVVSSLSWQLLASPRHRMCPPLSTALGTAGLVEVKELGCWIGPSGGGAFTGLLVIETDGDHSLHVYAREMKQVVLLVHSLRSQWKVRVKNEKGASIQDCMSAMRSELCVLRSITRPGAEHSVDQWTHIREQLNPLELATDLTFASHLPL